MKHESTAPTAAPKAGGVPRGEQRTRGFVDLHEGILEEFAERAAWGYSAISSTPDDESADRVHAERSGRSNRAANRRRITSPTTKEAA